MLCNLPCRIVLIVMNTVSMIVGLVLLILGALMVWGQSVIQSLLNNFITNLINQYIKGTDSGQINEMVTRILTSTSPVGMAVFILGAVCTGISLFGYCGACCNMKILLYIYAILVGALALAFLITFSVYFSRKDEIGNRAIDLFETSVKNYQSMAANTIDSLVVGLISPPLQCCGVNNGDDFTTSPNFWRNDTYGGKTYNNIAYPVVCCKLNQNYAIIDSTCPDQFNENNSNYKTGCRGPLKELFLKYMDFVAYGLIAAFVILLLVVIFTLLTIYIDVI
ncbi:putative tetraspanin-CD63 receptor [Schistosoma mansoni]|uniref:putative tetraspanin-CD63 receptor n=1 Tax=Schistosoma mansoni TaxID=6183 RepID=UPI00022DBFCA|nr:putative tetraspanin-CD63 receptor [Schistosoma mansoni]|eukprot:XP_018653608.1 putative tetraspanin-CD63 receptor [Schistosoma mansoni]